jgi:hypothetical protein
MVTELPQRMEGRIQTQIPKEVLYIRFLSQSLLRMGQRKWGVSLFPSL